MIQTTIEIDCLRCEGFGEIDCCECSQLRDCPDCDGEGVIESIGDFKIPEKHKNWEELERLQRDYDKCHVGHEKLCMMNPRAKESYDAQLAATCEAIKAEIKNLL